VAVAALGLVSMVGVAVVPTSVAGASGTATLYVDHTYGTKTVGCTSPGTGACKTIQEGINAAEALRNTAVTVDVAGSSVPYQEVDQIDIVVGTNDTLHLQGTGPIVPTLTDNGTSTNLTLAYPNTGAVTVTRFIISGGHSSSYSGGIENLGTGSLTVDNDTFTGNVAAVDGGGAIDAANTCGGIGGQSNNLTVINSTFTNNSTGGGGGAIDAADCTGTGTFIIENSTFKDNTGYGQVDLWQGGTFVNNTLDSTKVATTDATLVTEGVTTVTNDTFTGSVGPAIDNGGTVNLANSILDEFPSSCTGNPITDKGYNVAYDSSCGLGSKSISNSSAINVQALATNGSAGPKTEAIESSSSAYHEVPKSACTISTDERGRHRPGIGSACDAGAFELEPPAGYDLVGSDGGVFVFPSTGTFYGSLPGLKIHVSNITGIVPTLGFHGYDLVGSDGGVFVFPLNAPGGFYGSLPGIGVKPQAPIVGIVPNATDTGYFLVGKDGGVFAFHTTFAGSLPGIGDHVNDVVGIAATADDKGYWVVEADGVVHGFGDATGYGNAAARVSPAVSIAATPDGGGYWVAYADGVVVSVGDAVVYGAPPAPLTAPIVSLVPTTDGLGYWLVGKDGNLSPRGDAGSEGTLPALHVSVNNIVGAVPTG
jgi:predicted outer membrane repeat protein